MPRKTGGFLGPDGPLVHLESFEFLFGGMGLDLDFHGDSLAHGDPITRLFFRGKEKTEVNFSFQRFFSFPGPKIHGSRREFFAAKTWEELA